ncbi:MAG: MlaD family protein [Pseudolabrys sp.]
MEDKAKYALIGLFTFAVIAGVFGFVYWLHQSAGSRESVAYRVIFSGAVTGLRVGAPVLFNGIRVGEVSGLGLTDNPAEVAATIAINPTTPVRSDTRVTLEYAGLTGIASVSLKGVKQASPPLDRKSGVPPTMRADPNAGQDMSQAVRETLTRADAILLENQESLRNAIKNLENFTGVLARNGDKLDSLVTNSSDAMSSVRTLADNLDKRSDDVVDGINKLTGSTKDQVETVGKNLNRAIGRIEAAVIDLTKNPHRFIFGGSNSDR